MMKYDGYSDALLLQRDKRIKLEITIPRVIKSKLLRVSEKVVRRLSKPATVNDERILRIVVHA